MKFQVSKFLIRPITTSDLIFRSRASKKWMKFFHNSREEKYLAITLISVQNF